MPPELDSVGEWLALIGIVVTLTLIAHYLFGIGKP